MLRIYYPGPYSDKLQTTTSFQKEGVQNRLTVLSGQDMLEHILPRLYLTKTAPGAICLFVIPWDD